jgi:hypothetical protein
MQGKAPRGAIRRLDDGRQIVGLFRDKDASTVIHEVGHFFLKNLREAALLEGSPQWVKDSWAKLQKAYGFDGSKHWAQSETRRAIHERFAREFEAYAREGVAPSPELAGAFEQFKAWLTDVYKSVKRLLGKDKELSPEVREVFDSLLVTEHENIRKTAPENRPESSERRNIPDDPFADSAYRRSDEELAAMQAELRAHELDVARLEQEGRVAPEDRLELEAAKQDAARADTLEDISLSLVGCALEAL